MQTLSKYKWPNTTILIAEHDKFTRDLLKMLFKFTTSEIIEVLSADKLINELNTNSNIKVVIINDCFDGQESAEIINAYLHKFPEIHFIICSSLSQINTFSWNNPQKVDVLGKPFSPRKLMHLIDIRIGSKKVIT